MSDSAAPGGLSVLAVDDERSQLQDLARLLRSSPAVKEVQCAGDGREALAKASAHPFDAIFLDVRMPDLDGVELSRVLRRFSSPPQLVFVTAHESAAVEAFELHALDYLLKPVGRDRLEDALQRVASAVGSVNGHAEAAAPGNEREVVAVSSMRSGSTRLVHRSSILYVQSHGDFVRLVTAGGRYLLRNTLSDLEQRWEAHGFVRVHRQYLANLNLAVELRPQFGGTAELLFEGGVSVPVARRHVADLGRRLGA